MIKSFDYLKGTKIKLWMDELPDTIIADSLVMYSQTNVNTIERWDNKKIAIELSLQKHNSSYGLLGFELVPDHKQDNLEIEVHYSNKNDRIFYKTMSYNKKTVFSTLPEEYAETILKKSVDFINNNNNLPSGKLIFKAGAHCEVGSSKALFSIITDSLLSILLLNKNDYEIKEIEKIFDKFLMFK